MKNKFITLTVASIVIAALQGCISINPNGYEQLSSIQKQKVVRPNRPLEQLVLCDTIYVVNDNDVRDFLKDKDLAVVCCYLTWCTSEFCISPDLALNQLQRCGLPFVMIAGDFVSAKGYNADYPFMTIDSEYYKTKRYNRSIKRMFQALGCGENWWQRYFLFRKGEFVGSAETLKDLMRLCK